MTDDNIVRRLQHCCHLALFDSSGHSQNEGTIGLVRDDSKWSDIAAMELRAQRHLQRHSGQHSGKCLYAYQQQSVITSASAAETASVRKSNNYSPLSGTHDFFSSGTGDTSLDP